MPKVRMSFQSDVVYRVAEHECLMSFYDDDGAVAFSEWWVEKGEDQFIKWCLKNNYEGIIDKND